MDAAASGRRSCHATRLELPLVLGVLVLGDGGHGERRNKTEVVFRWLKGVSGVRACLLLLVENQSAESRRKRLKSLSRCALEIKNCDAACCCQITTQGLAACWASGPWGTWNWPVLAACPVYQGRGAIGPWAAGPRTAWPGQCLSGAWTSDATQSNGPKGVGCTHCDRL